MYHINRRKDKNLMIISVPAEKAFDKIKDPFIINILNKLRTEVIFLNLIKSIFGKSTANILLDD